MHMVVKELEGLLAGYSRGDTGMGGEGGGERERWFFEKVAIEGAVGECIYDDFSFLALGESAPWEFTPFTPLALSFFDLLLEGTCFFFKV